MIKRIKENSHMFSKLFVVIFLIILGLACSTLNSRVINKTENSAVIQGIGITKIEAKMNAEKRVQDVLGKSAVIEETECAQEYHAKGDEKSVRGGTYWSCVLKAKKKD